MNYDHILFDTGDLLLFTSGRSTNCCLSCLDCIIKCATCSKYVHCGIIIKNPVFTPEPLTGLYFLESTGLETYKDAENGMCKFGVQLSLLEDVLRTYTGRTYWRQMVGVERNQLFYRRLADAHSVVHNRPYDVNLSDWINAAFNIHVGQLHRRNTFFCSALAAFIYTALEILPRHTPWSEVRPVDLSSSSRRRNISEEFEKYFKKEVKI